jgi:outer membrane protein TolC
VKPRMNLKGNWIWFSLAWLPWLLSLPAMAQDTREGLTLKECLATALAKNPTVVEAGLAIMSAEEAVASAGGKHWPRLSLDGAYTRREEPFP